MEKLFEYLTDLSGGVAYWIIFGVLIACGLGFPLPEDIPLIATGYLIWDGTLHWEGSLLITIGGVLIGDSILFVIGNRLGLAILNKKKSRIFPPEKVRRTRAYFRKYGDKIVFFARFVAGFRAVAFFMAGAMHMRYRKFLLYDSLAAVISVPVWIGIGYWLGKVFGDEISDLLLRLKEIKTIFTVGVAIIIAIVVGRLLFRYFKIKKNGTVRKAKA